MHEPLLLKLAKKPKIIERALSKAEPLFPNLRRSSHIFHNGTIRPMLHGDATLTISALAIHDGAVVAIGTVDECTAFFQANSLLTPTLTDLKGKCLLPGLIEPHLHILSTSLFDMWIDVSPFNGQNLQGSKYIMENCKTVIKDALLGPDKDLYIINDWALAFGLDPSLLFSDGKIPLEWEDPTKTVLDEITVDIGVDINLFIMNSSGHVSYTNSKALETCREELTEIGYEAWNTGILLEMEEVTPVLRKALAAQMADLRMLELLVRVIRKMRDMFAEAASRGVTLMWDALLGMTGMRFELEIMKALADTCKCPVRLGGAVLMGSPTSIENWKKQNVTSETYNDPFFNVKYAKVISDGSNQGLTGFQKEIYPNPDVNINDRYPNGVYNFEPPLDLKEFVKQLIDDNWNLMIHANGTEAVEETITAYKNAIGGMTPDSSSCRHRIEHCSLLSDAHLDDMQSLSISPSFLIGHVGYWGYSFQNKLFTKGGSETLDRTKSALQRGLRPTLHSDHFVSPLGPLRMAEQAVTRRMEVMEYIGDGSVSVLNEKECVTMAEALRAITYDAAWQCHSDQRVGHLGVGMRADLVILAEDPMKRTAVGLRDVAVVQTWMDGRVTFQSGSE